jgi:hypothetical protein
VGIDLPKIAIDEEIPAGTIIKGFEYIVPNSDEVCQAQIAANLKRGYPEALDRRKLTVIASGPSAQQVDLRSIKTPILAVNGALSLFLKTGLWPRYWACCDSQEVVADFLPDYPPFGTTYLVGSKCHPKVFEKLKDRDVLIWHLKDQPIEGKARISVASSITICASWLMYRLGYSDFDYWGWDGCFMDGKHHVDNDADWSSIQRLNINYGGTIEGDDVIGGKTFETTRTWAAEAQGAEQFFQLAEYFDMQVTVNGGGMFAAAREAILKS